MEAGDDQHGLVFFDYEKQRIRKAAEMRPAHVPKDHRELRGILTYALDQGVNRLAKAPAQASYFPFIPVLCPDQLRAAGLRESDRML